MATVIYEDEDVQIVGYDDDDGRRGDTFGLYENGIDIDTGGQREFIHIRVDRGFFQCIETVKPILLDAIESYRYLIKKRRERGAVIPLKKGGFSNGSV